MKKLIEIFNEIRNIEYEIIDVPYTLRIIPINLLKTKKHLVLLNTLF